MTAVLLMLAAILPTAAAPPIDTAASCSLTIQTEYAGSPLSGMRFSLYRVATAAESGYYTLTADYAASGTDVNGVTDAGGWRAAAESLAAWTAKHSVAALAQATSDAQYGQRVAFVGVAVSANQKPEVVKRYVDRHRMPWTQLFDAQGEATFAALTPGLYLVGETRLVAGRQQYIGGAFLVALPGITDAGVWFYDVTAIEKVEEKPYKPPTPPDTTKPGETTEPTGTTASGATGTTAPEETTIPGEVTGTTAPEETTTPGGSTEPGETTEPGTTTAPGGDLPQTGQLKWPVPVMFAFGVLLSIIGILLRRRDDDA